MCDGDPEQLLQRIVFVEMDSEKYQRMKDEFYAMAAIALFHDVELTFSETRVTPLIPPSTLAVRDAMATVSVGDPPNYLYVADFESVQKTVGLRMSLITASGRSSLPSQNWRLPRTELERVLSPFDPNHGLTSAEALATISRDLSKLLFPAGFADKLCEAGVTQRPLRVVHDALASKIPWEVILFDSLSPALPHGLSRHYLDGDATRKWLSAGCSKRPLMC